MLEISFFLFIDSNYRILDDWRTVEVDEVFPLETSSSPDAVRNLTRASETGDPNKRNPNNEQPFVLEKRASLFFRNPKLKHPQIQPKNLLNCSHLPDSNFVKHIQIDTVMFFIEKTTPFSA